MPNWCSNTVEIVGPRDKIRALWETAQKGEQAGGGLLQGLHPMPAELKDTTSPGDTPNWYDWRVNNWSTKWEVGLEGLEYEEDDDSYEKPYARITGWFDSAWAPPTGAMAHYGAPNEDVKITLDYYEPGMGFVGRYTIEEGVDDDVYYELSGESSETVRELIGEDMDDHWNISENMAEWEAESEEE